MTQNTTLWVRRIYFVLITLALILAAVLLMVQCVAIYRLGDDPFTRESVAAHFAPIAAPVYVCIGLVAVGIALSPLLPAAPDSAPDRDAVTLRRLQAKTDLSACPADLVRAVCGQRRLRNVHHAITLTLLTIGTVVFLWYALDVSRFSVEDINGSMIKAMLLLAPCMGVPAIYAVITAYLNRRSIRREIDLLRTAPKSASPALATKGTDEKWLPYVQSAILVVGVALVVAGLLDNGAAAVLTKAINICTECIGLG